MPVQNRPLVSFALKTLTSAVASAVLLAASANAAGLGKLTVQSALGQPLRAEIELTAVSADEAAALVAKLAPADAFRAANIDFNPALLSMHFDIESRNGRQVIKVTSSQPINEPFVDMLLELNWNGGRMVREYTFLLDPPDIRAAQAPQVTAPVDVSRSQPAPAAQPAPAPAVQPPAPQPAAARPAAPAAPVANEYTVKPGDNLSRIASEVKPVDVSLDMMLVALYRANPDAFSGKNMNRLKSGQILSVPDADTVRNGASESEARSLVVAHAADFNAYRAKLAGQVAASTAAAEPDTSQNVSGKITAKVEEKPTAANTAKDKLTLSKATTGAPVEGKTGMAAEDKVARAKAAEEASARVKELEKNVNDLEKLMAVKNKAAADAGKNAAASVSASASTPASALAAASAPPKPKRTLVLPPKKPLEPSLFETLMDNVQYVGMAALAVLAGALGIVASRRRKKFVVPDAEPSGLGDSAMPQQSLIAEAGGQSVDTNNSVFNSNFAPSASQLDTNEVDPVAEADVYIAYGRDAQAEEILKEALRTQPERHPVRLKLLEIYAARRDARAFETQASELYSQTRGQGNEWAQAAAMGQALDPANPLYTMGKEDGSTVFAHAPEAAAVAAGAGAAAAAAEFGHTYTPAEPAASGLDLDLGHEAAPAAAPAASGMDFGASEETALPPAADASVSPASVAAESSNLMDFDLGGLSFEPVSAPSPAIEMPAPAEEQPAPAPADDLGMDFGLDLPAAPTHATEESKPAAADPLDLDLMGFEIPEVPALAEPPKAAGVEAEPEHGGLDFGSLDIPGGIEVTSAPAPAPQEFDLSGIDLDLDSKHGAATEAAPAARDDVLSAHHMEMDTKLDLAVAYQEIGDKEGARELLDEVIRGGSDSQVARANEMKAKLG